MSTRIPLYTGSSPGVRLLLAFCAGVVVVGSAVGAYYLLRPGRAVSDNQGGGQRPLAIVPSEPESSSPVDTGLQKEQIPEGDIMKALSGEYTGTIVLPEADISGEAALIIKEERFSLQPKQEGRRLSGHMLAKNMGDYVAVQLIFDERAERAQGISRIDYSAITEANYSSQKLPNLSLRATLTGSGWLIESAPDEKHEIRFVQTNCPPYPYCKPVRRCRPCAP